MEQVHRHYLDFHKNPHGGIYSIEGPLVAFVETCVTLSKHA